MVKISKALTYIHNNSFCTVQMFKTLQTLMIISTDKSYSLSNVYNNFSNCCDKNVLSKNIKHIYIVLTHNLLNLLWQRVAEVVIALNIRKLWTLQWQEKD